MKAIHRIAIHKFEECPPYWIATKRSLTMGYWISFTSEVVSGSAVLIPCGNGVEELRDRPSPQYVSVETGAKAYENFRLLADDEVRAERSQPLPKPGDYELVGQIWQVLTEELRNEIISVKIFVGSLGFDLSKEYINGVEVEEGAWVQFRVLELALYDVNY